MGSIRLDHVQIAAPPDSESQARAFYGGTLGLDEIPKPEPLAARGGVWFAAASGQLHVGIEEPFAPARKAHPAFVVDRDELDRLAGALARSGAPVRWDDALLPTTRRFYTEDPWGNRVELLAGVA